MAEHETIADIIAAMRGGPIPQHRHDRVLLCHFADRLEAAHKRESGDCAKLREALMYAEQVLDTAARNVRGETGMVINSAYSEAARKCRAALAAPPRNCDVGTAEEQEKRFHDFCRARHLPRMEESRYCAYKCPLEGDTCCELQWAQMPYIEKEGGAK